MSDTTYWLHKATCAGLTNDMLLLELSTLYQRSDPADELNLVEVMGAHDTAQPEF